MSGALLAMVGAGLTFQPIVHTYSSGSGTETIPNGAGQVVIEDSGAGQGGQGGTGISLSSPGHDGGKATKTIALMGTDWGKTFSYSVGAGGAGGASGGGTGSAGGNSTVTNGTFGTSVSMSGQGGQVAGDGTASGGGTNVTGGGSSGGQGVVGFSTPGNVGTGGVVKFTYS